MALRETLQRILTEYAKAKVEPLENHPLAQFIRHDAAQAVGAGLGELGTGVVVEGSPGQGNWAAVPWISIFDPAITTSATRGYYVVYLFHASEPVVHLSLNQGTTAVREEFGARTREILGDRANLMRKRVQDFTGALPATTIDLGSTARLPGDYVAGHAFGASYALDALPGEATLRGDLQAIVRAYRALTYRGGIDADVETQTDLAEEFGIAQSSPVPETRKYAYHRKIDCDCAPTARATAQCRYRRPRLRSSRLDAGLLLGFCRALVLADVSAGAARRDCSRSRSCLVARSSSDMLRRSTTP
jgi:5-methylcytosine-specific restriction enzyme A